MRPTIQPLSDRVLVLKAIADNMSEGGLHLTGSSTQPEQAEVLAIGPGRLLEEDFSKREPMEVKPGDKILITKGAGLEIKTEDKTLHILEQRDILAVFK